MLKPETTADECQSCRVCRACLMSVHSCCFPVRCATTGELHDCNCPVCEPRRLP